MRSLILGKMTQCASKERTELVYPNKLLPGLGQRLLHYKSLNIKTAAVKGSFSIAFSFVNQLIMASCSQWRTAGGLEGVMIDLLWPEVNCRGRTIELLETGQDCDP